MTEFLLWNKTAGYAGDCPLFWRAGGGGYTPNIDNSERFTEDAARRQIRSSAGSHDFVAVPVEVAEKAAFRVVDVGDLNKQLQS